MRSTAMVSKWLALTALAASLCLAQPAHAQGTPAGNVPESPAADTGSAPGLGGHGFEIAPAWDTASPFWFATAPVYEPLAWQFPSAYPGGWGWGFPFIYSPPYPGPLNPADFAVYNPASAYANLPMLGINTSAHTAGGEPVRYIHTRIAINLVPGE
jgi:hypothetical protein